MRCSDYLRFGKVPIAPVNRVRVPGDVDDDGGFVAGGAAGVLGAAGAVVGSALFATLGRAPRWYRLGSLSIFSSSAFSALCFAASMPYDCCSTFFSSAAGRGPEKAWKIDERARPPTLFGLAGSYGRVQRQTDDWLARTSDGACRPVKRMGPRGIEFFENPQ
mmetsp:Transcript_35684/g.63515  ORF Transcript_35684/g.63515 Transcript_35684/m.63515 type:complete len:162 (+) Transcript_35684:203-688(+)